MTAFESHIAASDSQLDTLIYALYGLTDAEIKIVEASTAASQLSEPGNLTRKGGPDS